MHTDQPGRFVSRSGKKVQTPYAQTPLHQPSQSLCLIPPLHPSTPLEHASNSARVVLGVRGSRATHFRQAKEGRQDCVRREPIIAKTELACSLQFKTVSGCNIQSDDSTTASGTHFGGNDEYDNHFSPPSATVNKKSRSPT